MAAAMDAGGTPALYGFEEVGDDLTSGRFLHDWAFGGCLADS